MSIATREMPKYKCHKEVWALKIAGVERINAAILNLHFVDLTYIPMVVSDAWVKKNQPQSGGYFVVYEDGYSSYSPPGPFENGYTQISGANEDVGYLVKEYVKMRG